MGTTLSRPLRAGVATEQKSQITSLVSALKDQDYNTVRKLFRRTNPHEKYNLLHFCIRSELYEQLEFLLKHTGGLERRYLESLLMLAAEQGEQYMVTTILGYGVDVNGTSASGYTALSYAVKYRHSDVTTVLLAADADTNLIDVDGNSLLIQAIGNRNNINTVSVLLDNGADYSIKNLRKRNALFYAVDENMMDVATLLLEKGADIDSADDEGTTALMASSIRGYVAITKMLLSRGACLEIKDNICYTALMCAVQNEHHVLTELLVNSYSAIRSRNADIMESLKVAIKDDLSEMVKILLDAENLMTNTQLITLLTMALENGCGKEVMVSVLSQYKDLLFYAASNSKHESVLNMLISNKVPMNYLDSQGNSVLMYAVARGNINMVKELLHANVTGINIKNQCQQDALLFAVFVDDVTKAEELLEYKADVNSTEENGRTPLMYAALRGSNVMCQLLLRCGANVNLIEEEGFTVLMAAAQNNHFKVVEELIAYGVNLETKNDYGHDALFKAVQNQNVAIVRILLEHRAPVNSIDNSDNTPLIESCRVGDSIDIVKVLLDNGADVNKQGEDGFSALMCACKSGSTSFVELLLLHDASLKLTDESGRDAFHIAIYYAHADLAAFILQRSSTSLNKNDRMFNTPLITACTRGNTECVKMLLQEGASLRCENKRGYTALMFAIQIGNEPLVKQLIDNMNDPCQTEMSVDQHSFTTRYELHTNNPFTNGINLTSFTTYKEQHHLIHLVSRSNKKNNFLHRSENAVDVYACAGLSGNSDVLKEVVCNDPNVFVREDEIEKLVKAFENSTKGHVQSLSDLECNSGVIRRLVRVAICAAAKRDSVETLKELLQWHSSSGDRQLLKLVILIACLYGSENVIGLLMRLNIDANITFTPRWETPLAIALISKPGKATQIVPLLAPVTDLSKCFSLLIGISDQYRVNVTILMYASLMGNYAAVKELIKQGALVDQTTEFGLGAIHFCLFGRRGMQCLVGQTHEMNSVMVSNSSSCHFDTSKSTDSCSRSSSQEDLKECFCDILHTLLNNCRYAVNKCTEDGKDLISWATDFELEDFIKILNQYLVYAISTRDRFQEMVPKICNLLKDLAEDIVFYNNPDSYHLQKSYAERMSETCSTFTDALRNINNIDEPVGLFESLMDDDSITDTVSAFSTIELDSSLIITPVGLYELAERIENNCDKCATFLGVPCDKIIEIKEEYRENNVEVCYQILRHWHETLTSVKRRTCFTLLAEALNNSGFNDVTKDFKKIFTETENVPRSYEKQKLECILKFRKKSESELNDTINSLNAMVCALGDDYEDENTNYNEFGEKLKIKSDYIPDMEMCVKLTNGHEQNIVDSRAKLSANLALTDLELKGIEGACKHNVKSIPVEILRKWRLKWGVKATAQQLIAAFEAAELQAVTESITLT